MQMSHGDTGAQRRVDNLERAIERLQGMLSSASLQPTYLTTPLTSTSWDGDSFSTTGKTLIDLSAVFGVPAGVRWVYVRVYIRDSASAGSAVGIIWLSPDSTSYSGLSVGATGLANDAIARGAVLVPCTDGDIYYQIAASGVGTTDVWLEIWGYGW